MKDTNYLIKVENLTKEFDRPADGPLRVLDGVSLTISPGDTIALMGPNGCGKTTLLRIIAGELSPTSGKVFLDGKNATNTPAYERARFIGRVHQESYKSLSSDLTVEETLALATRRNTRLSLGFPSAHHVIEIVCGFSKKAAAFVEPRRKLATRTLSGGQRQLLAIITAILGQPRVLLLDEHQASLDEEFRTVANDLVHGFTIKSQGAFIAAIHDATWAHTNTTSLASFSAGNVRVQEWGINGK